MTAKPLKPKESTTKAKGPGRPATGNSMTSAIPRMRCHAELREQFDAIGGIEWLRQAIPEAYAKMLSEGRV